MKKLCLQVIFLLLLCYLWGQTMEETIAEISQLKSDLEVAKSLVEHKIAELNLSPLNIAPKDAFESEADYLNRLQDTQIEVNGDIVALRQQYLDPILEQLYALQSRTFTTNDLTITQGTYNPENETWPVTVNHGGYQRESVQINIPIKKDLARILNSSWDKTTLTGQLTVDYDNKIVLNSINITNQDCGLNYTHTQDRRWKEIEAHNGALQLGVSYTNRYIIRSVQSSWNGWLKYWVGLNDLNDPNLKLILGIILGQDSSGAGTLAVSPNELNVAYIDEGGKVCQQIIGTDSKKFSDKYDLNIYTLEYTPDGRYIFAGLNSGKVYVYESVTMKLVKIYNTSIGSFKRIKCPVGDVFYLLGYENDRVWVKAIDYKLGSVVKNISLNNIWNQFQINYGKYDMIVEARFTEDGHDLVIATLKNVCVIDLATVTLLAAYKNPDEEWDIWSATLSNDGEYWGLLKGKDKYYQRQYAIFIARAGDGKLVDSFIINTNDLYDPIISWTKDNKYLIFEESGLYRTGLPYTPQTPTLNLIDSYNFEEDAYAQNAIAAFEASNDPADLKYFEREISKGNPDLAKEPRTQYYYWVFMRYLALGDPKTALLWLNLYLESGDETYRDESENYLSILENQDKIFVQISIEPLPERLSSPYGEKNFAVSPDGQWLYFSAMTSDNPQQADIFRAPRINSQWGIPARVAELSTKEEEALCSFSMDGSKAWLSGKYSPGKADFDIYTSDLIVSQWQAPTPVAALNSAGQDLDPWVYEDSLMFFSSNRAGGFGGYDLYLSRFRNGAWTSPVNLGAAVNTPSDENAPFLDWSGKNLFYSSNAPVGLGGADLYRVAVLNGEPMEVSQPQNLGVPINSRHNELRYIRLKNSTESLVISDRGKQKKPNMYLAYTEYPEREGYYVKMTNGSLQWNWLAQTSQRSAAAEIELNGKVSGLSTIDAGTRIGISYIKDGEQHRFWAVVEPNGQYQATLPVAAPYTIELSAPGYYRHYYVLNANVGETTLQHDIVMSKLETQASVILNNIFFAYDSDEILPTSRPSLDNAVNTLLDNPGICVEISGHTSTEGSDDYNLELSRKRAKAVVEYLIRRGISAERLSWKGYGETKPLNDNSTDELKQKNRRVEFKVL